MLLLLLLLVLHNVHESGIWSFCAKRHESVHSVVMILNHIHVTIKIVIRATFVITKSSLVILVGTLRYG